MKGPEFCVVSVLDQFVNLIMGLGTNERWSSVVHDEKNNTSSENICLQSGVLAFLHFWRLVALSSHSRVQLTVFFIAFAESGKTEVRYFEVEVLVKENIFRFKISVGNALVIQESNGIDELPEQGAADFRWESTFLGNKVEKLSFCVLQDDDGSLLNGLGSELDVTVEFGLDDAHEILEFEFFKELNFPFEALLFVKANAINFNGINFIGFATQINTEIRQKNTWLGHLLREGSGACSRSRIGSRHFA